MKLINQLQNLLNKTGFSAKLPTGNRQLKQDPKDPVGTEVAGRPPRDPINQSRFPGTTV